MAVQADGKIVVVGEDDYYDDLLLMRFLPDGTLDGTFGGDGIVQDMDFGSSYDVAIGIEVLDDGDLIVAAMVSIGIMGFLSDRIIVFIRDRALRWAEGI